jgi:hypothetical protein
VKLYYATRKNEGRRTEVATVCSTAHRAFLAGADSLFDCAIFYRIASWRAHPPPDLWIDGILGLAMCPAMALAMFSKAFGREFSKLFGRWQGLGNIVERVLNAMAWYGKAPSVLIGALALVLSFLANLTLIAVKALGLYTVNSGAFPRSWAWSRRSGIWSTACR